MKMVNVTLAEHPNHKDAKYLPAKPEKQCVNKNKYPDIILSILGNRNTS